MKYILPRFILGNYGDLASRWGLLRALDNIGIEDVTVFSRDIEDVPKLPYRVLTYRPLKNLLQGYSGWRLLLNNDYVLWSVGLDLQDDSSLVRIIYLWITFKFYRILGLRIISLFQGAGPITTKLGASLAKKTLQLVDIFVARDPGTYKLVGEIDNSINRVLAYDAIFLPDLEEDIKNVPDAQMDLITPLVDSNDLPVIGINIRQWFHFTSSFFPYELSKKTFVKRSQLKMREIIDTTVQFVRVLRQKMDAKILLISAYQPGIVPWEDDMTWLTIVGSHFLDDDRVVLVNEGLSIPGYFSLISRLDLVVGMRLHTTLTALRFGVPAINISYTLKGNDFFQYLGLDKNVFDLSFFLTSPEIIVERVQEIFNSYDSEKEFITLQVQQAIDHNMKVLQDVLSKTNFPE